MLEDAGVQSVKLPQRSPNLNAYAERFVRSIKEACLEASSYLANDHCGRRLESSWRTTTTLHTAHLAM